MGIENPGLMQSLLRNTWALITIIALVVASFISIYLMIERIMRFRAATRDSSALLGKIRKNIRKGSKIDRKGIDQSIDLCKETGGPIAAVLRSGLIMSSETKVEMNENMQKTAMLEVERLEENLTIIGSIGSVAPFIGLLGTVIGVYEAFMAISTAGAGGMTGVGQGIAQALVATIIGLFVAIPAVIGYNLLVNRVNRFMTEITVSAAELTNIIFSKDSAEKGE
ncbi:MAG: MotA/TolQ/ExbB proton channel family protein [Candidatus Firestonebacteria bacterium]